MLSKMLFNKITKTIIVIIIISIILKVLLTNLFIIFYLLPASLIFVALPTSLLILIDYYITSSKHLNIVSYRKFFIRYMIYGILIGLLFGLMIFKDIVETVSLKHKYIIYTFIMCISPTIFVGVMTAITMISLLTKRA